MALIQHQCPRFHLYNAPEGDDRGCPVCAALQPELTRTRGVWGDAPVIDDASQQTTASPGGTGGAAPPGKTVGLYAHLGVAADPVVGWLACVDGPDKGRDWRLVSGRNAIGRGEGMPVRLASDPAVSRDRHAVISFDPRRLSFSLVPGDGHGLVYCNGQEVVMPVTLAAHDRIELGASVLLFVPLVGPRFSWDL